MAGYDESCSDIEQFDSSSTGSRIPCSQVEPNSPVVSYAVPINKTNLTVISNAVTKNSNSSRKDFFVLNETNFSKAVKVRIFDRNDGVTRRAGAE